MTRRCSHCSNNGHNSRTCPNRGVKLFGVRLTDGSIRKSASMGNLSLFAGSTGGSSPADGMEASGTGADGYASEDLVQGSSSSCRERKRGIPWTEEEHRMFLLGLQKLGKGDWRGISRKYVITRTPTQVASHAQKYFIRQSNANRRRRRSSLFDMIPDEPAESELFPMNYQEQPETQDYNCVPAPSPQEEECESMDSNNSADEESEVIKQEISESQCGYQVMYPAYFSPFFSFTPPPWPVCCAAQTLEKQLHEIVKPTPLHTKSPIKVDELLGMSRLSIGESGVEEATPSPSPSLSVNLLVANRHSAFHANYPARPKAA